MEIIDVSGKPRTDEELIEAKLAIEQAIIRDATKIPPSLFVWLSTIRDALVELINIRSLKR